MRNDTQMIRRITVGLCAALGATFFIAPAVFAQEASTAYRGTGRDPFVKYKPSVRRKAVKKVVTPLPAPSIQERIAQYKAQKMAAMNAQQPAPKPTTALLLGELQVIGISRTPRGYAALVEATPIKLSYVIYPGEMFFDGLLVAIQDNSLIFRRETKWSNGRREITVETKPLRQPNAVEDSMTTSKTSTPTLSSTEAVRGTEESASATGKQ